eukprot:TRINITY_DN16925_c0_g1_i2.p1 TRINITY_DN16925_c0_g1~~TRINITY_DN16925_c0_g1_i2.p1  ORF type:complete len:826 (+),score=182.00 TRINITY_DN16925_c0_g1_i2:66-2543(+)
MGRVDVSFEVECSSTRPGEAVYVAGSAAPLGSWEPARALPLVTSSASFPLWKGTAAFSEGSDVEFKFLIRREDGAGNAAWEPLQGNRRADVQAGLELARCRWGEACSLAAAAAIPSTASAGTTKAAGATAAFAVAKSAASAKGDTGGGYASPAAVTLAAQPTSCSSAWRLRVKLPQSVAASLGASGRVVACGAAAELGAWNPSAGAPLHRDASAGAGVCCRWEMGGNGEAPAVPPGTLFKYVVLPGSGAAAKWEENRKNREWPSCDGGPEHLFDCPTPRQAAGGDELVIDWGSEDTPGAGAEGGFAAGAGSGGPSAIFHAFNWRFEEVARRAQEIAEMGFDAVQLSPAQRSIPGDQWWTRYQPVKYEEINGLGDENQLRQACEACARVGLQVFGDLVFNHMQVVASCDEWRRAQHDQGYLDALKGRLEHALGPTFNRDDFQWPWFALEGKEWDGPRRMEGWGCGEWSELRGGSPKVVAVHTDHMRKLRACGVSGFRFDAAKHMRPEHIATYCATAQTLPGAGGGAAKSSATPCFVFGEVLSVDPAMQKEYLDARPPNGSAPLPSGQCPTTDFLLAVWLRTFLEGGESKVDVNPEQWVRHLLAVEQGDRGSQPPPRLHSSRLKVPVLARNSVRFARNHDTVCNDVPFYGLGGWNGPAAELAGTWLLAAHDGAVLLLSDDVKKSHLLRQALRYRRGLRERLGAASRVGDSARGSTDVRATRAAGGGPPMLVVIACRRPGEAGGQSRGSCVGFCALNPGPRGTGAVEFHASAALLDPAGTGGAGVSSFTRVHAEGNGSCETVSVTAQGALETPVLVEPGAAVFFLAAR